MNEILFWLVLLVVLIAAEVVSMGLTTIWFAGGALVAMIASACNAPLFLQFALFLIVSVVLLIFTRPVAMRYFNRDRTRTNVDSVLGQKGIVTGRIDNLNACGQVTLNGMEWTARSVDPNRAIPEGAVVIVTAVNGVKLIVKEEIPEGEREG